MCQDMHSLTPGIQKIRVELTVTGSVVKCKVSDNGSVPEPVRRGRGLTIIGEMASSLGGRVHTLCAAERFSFLLTFPLIEAEQRAADATNVVKRWKTRRLACMKDGSEFLTDGGAT
jgi:hypothetical protein